MCGQLASCGRCSSTANYLLYLPVLELLYRASWSSPRVALSGGRLESGQARGRGGGVDSAARSQGGSADSKSLANPVAEIESVPVITASSQVRNEAQKTMDPSLVSSNYSVNATLQPGINNLYSNVVTLTGVSSNATLAAVAANAYAQAFVAWGRGGARSQVASSISDAR